VDLARGAGEVAGQLDELVTPAREPENAVLVDNARVVRWAGPAFALFSLILLPWIAYLAYSLPARQVTVVAADDGVLDDVGQQEQDDEIEDVEAGQVTFPGKPEQDQDRRLHHDGTQDLLRDRDLDSKH
jgi:hypothetical protein